MKNLNIFKNASDFITVEAGEVIFEQDQGTDSIYVLFEGQVAIMRDGKELVTIGPNNLIGEMAFLENRPHFASAVALEACQLVPIDSERFRFLVEQTPNFAIEVMAMLAERLHQMNIKAVS